MVLEPWQPLVGSFLPAQQCLLHICKVRPISSRPSRSAAAVGRIDFERKNQPVRTNDAAASEVDCKRFGTIGFQDAFASNASLWIGRQYDRQNSVADTVTAKQFTKTSRDDAADAKRRDRPCGTFARTARTEVSASNENAGSPEQGLVEDKAGVLAAVGVEPPAQKQLGGIIRVKNTQRQYGTYLVSD